MIVKTITAGVLLASLSLSTQAAIMLPDVEDIAPIGDPQQMSTADSIDVDVFDTSLEFGPGDTVKFHYFGNNTGGPYPNGTTRIDFELGEDGILNTFGISDGIQIRAVVLTGDYEGGAVSIGDDMDPSIKLIGFVQGDGGKFCPDGSPVGIIVSFPGAQGFRNGFMQLNGMANVFTLGQAPAAPAPEGSTLLLLLGGGLGVIAVSLRRRRGHPAA